MFWGLKRKEKYTITINVDGYSDASFIKETDDFERVLFIIARNIAQLENTDDYVSEAQVRFLTDANVCFSTINVKSTLDSPQLFLELLTSINGQFEQ